MEVWTREKIEGRMREAMRVLSRLSARGCFPSGYKSTLPDPLVSFWEMWNGLTDDERTARAAELNYVRQVNLPAEISRMEQAIRWRKHVADVRHWQALCAWAARGKSRRVANELGTDRKTLWHWRRKAANEIATGLNTQ